MRIFKNLFFRPADDNPYPSDKHCCVCERKFHWWSKTVRIYSLGMTRAHIVCASNFLKHELETVKRVQSGTR